MELISNAAGGATGIESVPPPLLVTPGEDLLHDNKMLQVKIKQISK